MRGVPEPAGPRETSNGALTMRDAPPAGVLQGPDAPAHGWPGRTGTGALAAAHARVPAPPWPCRSRAARFVSRRMARTLRTASAQALGCPISTTSCLPRVTPV